jgi:hypothetical protein
MGEFFEEQITEVTENVAVINTPQGTEFVEQITEVREEVTQVQENITDLQD